MNIDFIKHNRSVVHVSDRFRSIRFAMRNLINTIDAYEDTDKKAIPLIGTVSALAKTSESALSNVELKLHNHLSSDAKKHFGMAAACSLSLYQKREESSTKGDVALQFAGDQYFASKRVAMAFGISNILMHQARYLKVWSEFQPLLDQSLVNRTDESSRQSLFYLCSEYARILRSYSVIVFPSKHTDDEQNLEYDTNILIPSTVALVASVATHSEYTNRNMDSDTLYNNCVSLVRARYSRIEGLFNSEDADRQFEEFLMEWTPRLN